MDASTEQRKCFRDQKIHMDLHMVGKDNEVIWWSPPESVIHIQHHNQWDDLSIYSDTLQCEQHITC